MTGQDQLQRFLFENSNIRGSIVRLDDTFQQATGQQDYPTVVRNLVGQSLAACALMGDSLKFQGSLSLQAQGEGPLRLLVSDSTDQLTLRGLAHWNPEAAEAETLPSLIGNGHLVITITPDAGQRYQGIVPLEQDTLAGCLEDYFRLSEQLATFMCLFADEKGAAGLLLQQLPGELAGPDTDLWPRAIKLAQTLTTEEALQLPSEELIHRLYHQEQVRLFPARATRFGCSCSRERTRLALESLGQDDCMALLDEQEVIEIDCHFCGQRYRYDRADVRAVFGGPRLH